MLNAWIRTRTRAQARTDGEKLFAKTAKEFLLQTVTIPNPDTDNGLNWISDYIADSIQSMHNQPEIKSIFPTQRFKSIEHISSYSKPSLWCGTCHIFHSHRTSTQYWTTLGWLGRIAPERCDLFVLAPSFYRRINFKFYHFVVSQIEIFNAIIARMCI